MRLLIYIHKYISLYTSSIGKKYFITCGKYFPHDLNTDSLQKYVFL